LAGAAGLAGSAIAAGAAGSVSLAGAIDFAVFVLLLLLPFGLPCAAASQ
jgi:hypothetical protein